MKHFNIDVLRESVGLQVFDRYYAYRQSCNADNNYQSDIKITFGKPRDHVTNIAYCYMPTDWVNPYDYDFIFYENCSEGLEVSTDEIRSGIIAGSSYFLCGAYTTQSHRFNNSIIPWSLCHGLFLDRHNRCFYPGFYDRDNAKTDHSRKPIWFINGQQRTWRKMVLDEIQLCVPKLTVYNAISDEVWPTEQSLFESDDDTKLRLYLDDGHKPTTPTDYYSSAMSIGIDQKFGTIARGWFVMPEYYEYHCTVFPESTWLNDEIQPNEKFFKCCLAKTIPFPIGGASVNRLYNQFGFETAWNLLPESLQTFDSQLDHIKRYKQIALAVAWLYANPDVFFTEAAEQIKQKNYTRLFEPSFDLQTMRILDTILLDERRY